MVHKHLSRSKPHREALLKNLTTQLFTHNQISTTKTKAKEAQSAAEKVITLAKNSLLKEAQDPANAASIRAAAVSKIQARVFSPEIVLPKLFEEIAPRYLERPGGYTRVLHLEPRLGDRAPQSLLELVGNGEREMKVWLTAKATVLAEANAEEASPYLMKNISKAVRDIGEEKFEQIKQQVRELEGIAKSDIVLKVKELENTKGWAFVERV